MKNTDPLKDRIKHYREEATTAHDILESIVRHFGFALEPVAIAGEVAPEMLEAA